MERFNIKEGTLKIYDPHKEIFKDVKAGMPTSIHKISEFGEETHVFVKYESYRYTVMYRIQTSEKDDFVEWFNDKYKESNVIE